MPEQPIIDPKRELPPPHDMQLPMSHWQKIPKPSLVRHHRVLIGSILFVLLSIILAFYAYFAQSISRRVVLEQNFPLPTLTPSPMPDPTTKWKTYQNETYGYYLKYPQTFYAHEENSPSVGRTIMCQCPNGYGAYGGPINILVYTNQKGDIETFVAKLANTSVDDLQFESVLIDNTPAKRLLNTTGLTAADEVYIQKDNDIYVISLLTDQSALTREEYDHLLLSFKFLDLGNEKYPISEPTQ